MEIYFDAQRKEIAARLCEVRKQIGYTQQKFADLMGLTASAYQKLESGENRITSEHLWILGTKLNVSVDYILFGKRQNREDVWKVVVNASEADKMFMFLRLCRYFTYEKDEKRVLSEDLKKYDELILEILKSMNL